MGLYAGGIQMPHRGELHWDVSFSSRAGRTHQGSQGGVEEALDMPLWHIQVGFLSLFYLFDFRLNQGKRYVARSSEAEESSTSTRRSMSSLSRPRPSPGNIILVCLSTDLHSHSMFRIRSVLLYNKMGLLLDVFEKEYRAMMGIQ